MQFLADENLHAKLSPFLRSLGHDVRPVSKGTQDRQVAAQSKAESRILLTHDTDFSNTDQYPFSAHAGVVLIRINPLLLKEIQAALSKLFENISESELPGRFFLVFEETFVELKEGEFRLFPL